MVAQKTAHAQDVVDVCRIAREIGSKKPSSTVSGEIFTLKT